MKVADRSVVLLPGFMLDESLWDDLVPMLPSSWRVQRVVLPPGRTAFDVADGVARLVSERSLVVGFSMGGYVARALAGTYPELVEALVLVASSARAQAPGETATQRTVGALPRDAMFKGLSRRAILRSLGSMHASDDGLIDRVHAMSVKLGPATFAWQSALDRTCAPLRTLSCPTLVVAAEDDRIRSVDESRELADAIEGASFRVLPATGHLVPLEAPAALAASMVAWVEGLTEAGLRCR